MEDWSYAEALVAFFKKFYNATLRFSCYKKVTANVPFQDIFKIADYLIATIASGDVFMRKFSVSMKSKFDKYWGNVKEMNKLILVAIVLDPRYKLEYLHYGLDFLTKDAQEVDEMTQEIKDFFMRLYDTYRIKIPNDAQGTSKTVDESSDGNEMEKEPHLDKFLKRLNEKKVASFPNEVDRYLNERSENPKISSFNLLEWWKTNDLKLPILSKIAKHVLTVPVSSVASEAAFSAKKRVVNPFRACLTTKTVEALICTNDWLKGEAFNYFQKPTEDDIDFYKVLENIEKEIDILQLAEEIVEVD